MYYCIACPSVRNMTSMCTMMVQLFWYWWCALLLLTFLMLRMIMSFKLHIPSVGRATRTWCHHHGSETWSGSSSRSSVTKRDKCWGWLDSFGGNAGKYQCGGQLIDQSFYVYPQIVSQSRSSTVLFSIISFFSLSLLRTLSSHSHPLLILLCNGLPTCFPSWFFSTIRFLVCCCCCCCCLLRLCSHNFYLLLVSVTVYRCFWDLYLKHLFFSVVSLCVPLRFFSVYQNIRVSVCVAHIAIILELV